MGAEIELIESCRHAHGDDHAGGAAAQQLLGKALVHLAYGETWPSDLLQKALELRRNISEPERIDEDEMAGPADRLLGCGDGGRRLVFQPGLGAAEQGEVERSHVDAPDLVPGLRAFGISVGESMVEMAAIGIGMTVDDGDAGHKRIIAVAGGARGYVIILIRQGATRS